MENSELSDDIGSGHTSNLPSARGRRLFDEREIEETILQEVCKDRWHGTHNLEGKIDLCNDQNNLCEELFRHKISKSWPSNVAASLQQSPTAGGRKSTKKLAMSCIKHLFFANEKDELRADGLILTPGSDAAYDMLSFVLFSPGDVVLCPTPFTGRIYNDFEERAQVELRAVPSQNMLEIHLHTADFQQVLEEATTHGQNVRAISLTQSHNPLGVAFEWHEIAKLCEWAVKNNLWVLIDETFVSHIAKPKNKGSAIKSFVSLVDQVDGLKQKLIWVWSVDKDLCLPGLRFAIIHTQNDDVHKALSRLEIIQPCAPLVQSLVECLFGDLEFMSHFYEKKNHLLDENRRLAIQRLQAMGVPFVRPMAGTSVFLCLRKFIKENTFEQEEIMWKRLMSEASIYLNPGMFMGTFDAGWFQMIISMDKTELQEALNRLEVVLKSIGEKDTSADWQDSPTTFVLPLEASHIPDRASISSTTGVSVFQIGAYEKQEGECQHYESNAMETLLEAAVIESSQLGNKALPSQNLSLDVFESQLAPTPTFPVSQTTSAETEIEQQQRRRSSYRDFKSSREEEEAVASSNVAPILHAKTSTDFMDDIQLNKTNISSAAALSVDSHQPGEEATHDIDYQEDMSKANLPQKRVSLLQDFDFITQLMKSGDKNIQASAISPVEPEKSWEEEKYPYSYTHLNNSADDLLLRQISSEDQGSDDLIEQVFSVFPASNLECKEPEEKELFSPLDLRSKDLLSQHIVYVSEQRCLQRQASAAKKKLSAIEEGEDHLQEESNHHPPRVPTQLTDFSFIEQLVNERGHINSENGEDGQDKQLLNSIFPENHHIDHHADHLPDPADHIVEHVDNADDHQNAIEFDLVEEFEPIPLKIPSPQLTIDLPLRVPLKEEEIHINSRFHQMDQSETQSERIIEIIESIFLDAEVVAPLNQRPEDMPWSRSDSGLAADYSNTSSTADVNLGEYPALESTTYKRVAKGATSRRLEDSGVFVGDSLPGTLSVDFPLLIPMENEKKEVEIEPTKQIQPTFAQPEPLFSVSELRDLVGSENSEDHSDGHLTYQQSSEVKSATSPPKVQNIPALEFNFDMENNHFKPATELTWQPIGNLESEQMASSPPKSVGILERSDEEDLPPDKVLDFDNSLPQQYSEAELLGMLSEGSAFCPIQEDICTARSLRPPPSPLLTEELNVQKKSESGSTSSSVQKWEPLESLDEPMDESTSNKISKKSEERSKNSDAEAKKFSEELNAMEKHVEPTPRDPCMVIGEYNKKVHGKGPMPLGVVSHSPIPAEPSPSLEELVDIDLRFHKPVEEEWLTQVVWNVSAEDSQEAKYGADSWKKKSSKRNWRKSSAVTFEWQDTHLSRLKVSLSEGKDINKGMRRASSPILLCLGEAKDNKEKVVVGKPLASNTHLDEEPFPKDNEGQNADQVRQNDTKEEHAPFAQPQKDYYKHVEKPMEQDHVYLSEKRLSASEDQPFNVDNQQACTSKSYQSPKKLVNKRAKKFTKMLPCITVQSSHPIYYSKADWKHPKLLAKGAPPKFVRVCCSGRAVTPQVHHRMHMSRGYRGGDLRVGKNTIVMQHTNITQITYSGLGTQGRILEEEVKEMSTSASIPINSFAPNEFFHSLSFMGVNQEQEKHPKESLRRKDKDSQHYEIRKMKKEEDLGKQAEPLDSCCRMRVLDKPLGRSALVEEKENEKSLREYEYLVCKNPQHANSIDHCDPTRWYTIKRSTMPSASLCSKAGHRNEQVSERIKPANFADSTVDPANIIVSTQRNGTANTDTITLRHSPGSNWIISSVFKTVHYRDQTSNGSQRKRVSAVHKRTQV